MHKSENNIQMLTRDQFDVLSSAAAGKRLELSAETVACIRERLEKAGLLKHGEVTPEGLAALEPYRVKRAIFLAAGFGSRLVPISINTPKPLVRVDGKRIIDSLIDACLAAGIEEIYIVRGYLAEQFDQLLYKYPTIKFLDNPLYNEANNISSALCAGGLLSNAYVLEADLLVRQPSIITPYHYRSNFLAIRKAQTDDWCFVVEGNVIREEKKGGKDCWQMVGISYWNEEDGCRLAQDLPLVYKQPGGKEYYWEQIPLTVCKERYEVEIHPCFDGDVIEIDTFQELKMLDSSYDV